ncbi:MAG: hypothetical protein LLF92_02295 [Planctomycetaceae bacterium]|nr:hypothetical protein [Planctomycetaceae bacterium]
MNTQQKKLVANIITVSFFTIVMIVGFANIKNSINRAESIRAMNVLSKEIFSYRQKYGSLPNQIYVDDFIDRAGLVRVGPLQYRAMWIEYGSDPNSTILAYSEKIYGGFVKSGYIVLWYNGKVKWYEKKYFEKLLAEQQKKDEVQWMLQHLQKKDF